MNTHDASTIIEALRQSIPDDIIRKVEVINKGPEYLSDFIMSGERDLDAVYADALAYLNRVSRTSPRRRSRGDIVAIKSAMYDLLKVEFPCTVRQVFYRLVSSGVVEKREQEYKHTVARLLTEMRLNNEIPFGWIADSTRWMRKPNTYSSLEAMLKHSAGAYRRSVWDNQDCYVEIWLEKEALAGVLVESTDPWDVPLMVTRGYPSISYLHSAAEAIVSKNKPAYIYYFGDHDPSGLDISRNTEERLLEFTEGTEIHFERVAVTLEQIAELNLPTRPTKASDTRAKTFAGDSVEVDAIMPSKLREIAEGCITRHVNGQSYNSLLTAEASEREALTAFVDGMLA